MCRTWQLECSRRYEHVTPLLRQLHWLPVQYRVLYKIVLLTYKAVHGEAPGYLSDLIAAPRPVRSLRSTTHNVLASPRTRLKTYGHRAFSAAAPAVWNSIPPALRAATSCNSFKTLIYSAMLFRCDRYHFNMSDLRLILNLLTLSLICFLCYCACDCIQRHGTL